ncbi:DUF928 domain-containing protein [Tumidithrix elongata RA019]|uniref:DUF928 domain-containing protein n=1 Tax=Tumidithrix elongata BACA0141 TaxID=2716417 RepID=A0AAW9Q3W3_9CYAN|nr:DUF928 domain-containing protein [Tumidithrix elongata RA019]
MRHLAKNLKLGWLRSQTKLAGVVLSLLCLPALFGDDFIAIAQPKPSQYGLGIKPQQTGALHAPPSYCITAIAPQDGGRTLSQHPTLYLYLLKNKRERDTFISELRLTLKLDEGESVLSRYMFRVKVQDLEEGLYKIALPVGNFPNLNGKIQHWAMYGIDAEFSSLEYTSAYVRQEPNGNVLKGIQPKSTMLDKARIYAKYYYWYDAFDAYSQWLEQHPKDVVARRERAKMLKENLSSRCVDIYRYISFQKLLEAIDVKPAEAIAFPLKN